MGLNEFKKNDELELEIEDIGTEGEGIGHYNGFTFFVKDAIIGDRVLVRIMKLKKNYGYARLMEVLVPSNKRGEPKCQYYRQCGGCQLQALSYDEQLKFKEKKIADNLGRIGGFKDIPMLPIIGMDDPYFYRNKAQFPIGVNKKGEPVTGFYAGRTHNIIANTDCVLGVTENKFILEILLAYMKEYNISAYNEESGKGLIRHVLIRKGFTTGELMVCIIINGKSLPHSEALVEKLCELEGMTSISLNINRKKTNVILGDKLISLYGPLFIRDNIGDVVFQISPLSFYQVNPGQTKKLYDKVLEFADFKGNETVWDLYCGIGTISLYMAGHVKAVYGVEIVPQAIEDARKNAVHNHIDNAKFYVGKAEEVVPALYKNEGIFADVIVVDPPRKGCDEALLQTIIKMAPKKLVYVSCDSATLARDLKILCENGFRLEKVQGVDQFGQTVHVETVCLLSKLHEAKHHVNVIVDMDEMDLTAAESKATYEEIKKYVAVHNDGMKVSNLNIAQVKAKYGIIERENYNLPKSEDAKQPQCPKKKEDAIVEALRFFLMI